MPFRIPENSKRIKIVNYLVKQNLSYLRYLELATSSYSQDHKTHFSDSFNQNICIIKYDLLQIEAFYK